MDPALWEMLEGDEDDEVEAIIRLRDPDTVPKGVRLVAQFGHIATCRLRRGSILDVRASETVISLKAPRLVIPDLDVEQPAGGTLPQEGAAPTDQRRPPGLEATGRGVIVGVVDWGCDFAHPNFRHADGTTRIRALWDQRSPERGAANRYGYGTIHTAQEIDRALGADDPYAALRYHPAGGDPRGTGAHGTHVMDIAAGNGQAGGPVGVAPEADLVFVHLATRGTGGPANLGDSGRILEAVDFIHRTAGSSPCPINMSIGRTGGAHDATSLVVQGLDAAVVAAPGRPIVQSTGNYYNQRMHAYAQLRPGEARTFAWHTDAADLTPNELEVWYPGRDALVAELRSPDGTLSRRVRLGERASLEANGQTFARIYHRAHDPNNHDHHVDIFLYPGAPAGAWEVTLEGEDVVDGRLHAWVERDAACLDCQSRFDPADAAPSFTTGTICNGFRTIAVGAYNPHSPNLELAPFSSSGPTRDGRQKPDLIAPGEQILAARSAPRDAHADVPLHARKSGTSMAAPHVTGTIALMFEAARRPLEIGETRRLLLSSSQAADVPGEETARVGSGYLDIGRAVDAARAFTGEEQLRGGEMMPVSAGQGNTLPFARPVAVDRQGQYAEPQMQQDAASVINQRAGFFGLVETMQETTDRFDNESGKTTEVLVNREQECARVAGSENELLGERDVESLDPSESGDGLLEEKEDNKDPETQDLSEYGDDGAVDKEASQYVEWIGTSLIDLADEAISTVGISRCPGALLDQMLLRAGIAETLNPLGPGSGGFTSPAVIFDAFATDKSPALRRHFGQFLEVVAEPGSVIERDLRVGDLLIRRALGEGGLGHVAVIVSPKMWQLEELVSEGLAPEGSQPGGYVQVVEAGPRPHTRADSFARRALDEYGRLPLDTTVVTFHLPLGAVRRPQRISREAVISDEFAPEGDLTANFSLHEFSSRGTPVPSQYLANVRGLAQNLQVLRGYLGHPINVTSGYRTPQHNASVGGASTSQHLTASAADIRVDGLTMSRVYCAIEELIRQGRMVQGGVGIYTTHVHYDVRGGRARWTGRGASAPNCSLISLPTGGTPPAPSSVPGPCPDDPVPVSRRPRVLARGSVHSAVREAQRKLNAFHRYRLAARLPGLRDAPLVEDCRFGKHTFEAVKSFQELVFPGMPVEHDGKIGSHTWAQLDAVVVGPGPNPAAQLTVEQLRITHDPTPDGRTPGPLSWDQVIGLDTATLNLELIASGLPPVTMPDPIRVELSSRVPNRASGSATLGTPVSLEVPRIGPETTTPNRTVYRTSRPLADVGDFMKVERRLKEVTTIVRSGGTSDAEFRRALGWNPRGIATQPITPGASTGLESGEIPDAFALFRSAGVEVLEVKVPAQPNWRVPRAIKRLIRSPADVVYYSGHGLSSGMLAIDSENKPCGERGTYHNWLGAAHLNRVWTSPMDLDLLILAGCSVLKIDFSTSPPSGSGLKWAKLLTAKGGPLVALLGYQHRAPCDSPVGDRIAKNMAERMAAGSTNFARDWLEVNGDNNANNAVAMDARGYWWIEGTLFGGYDIKGPKPIP